MAKILGVDLSHWQANVDFDKLKANNVRFAIFKAGEIPTSNKLEFTDEKYERNISEAARVGIISGAYYFFHPSISGKRQARHFDAVMDKYGYPDLPPVIDAEVDDKREPGEVASVMKEMIDELENRGYRTPIIYSRWGFLVNQAGEPYWLKHHYLWLAQYNTQLVNKPADMSNVVMWQFTDKLRLPGVGLDLDGNYWLKTEAELLALVKKRVPVETQAPVQEEEQPAEEVEEIPEVEPEAIEEDHDVLIIPTQPALEPEEVQIPAEQEGDQEEKPDQIVEEDQMPVLDQSTEQEPALQSSESPSATQSTAGAGFSIWDMIVKLIQALLETWQKK